METRKLVVILLVIAIVLSAVNIVISLGFDVEDYSGGGQYQEQDPQTDSGAMGLEILPPPGGEE
ncbi:MAG: hypothetical protein ABIH92_00505 [Nanoarchaeota archaeon]